MCEQERLTLLAQHARLLLSEIEPPHETARAIDARDRRALTAQPKPAVAAGAWVGTAGQKERRELGQAARRGDDERRDCVRMRPRARVSTEFED